MQYKKADLRSAFLWAVDPCLSLRSTRATVFRTYLMWERAGTPSPCARIAGMARSHNYCSHQSAGRVDNAKLIHRSLSTQAGSMACNCRSRLLPGRTRIPPRPASHVGYPQMDAKAEARRVRTLE